MRGSWQCWAQNRVSHLNPSGTCSLPWSLRCLPNICHHFFLDFYLAILLVERPELKSTDPGASQRWSDRSFIPKMRLAPTNGADWCTVLCYTTGKISKIRAFARRSRSAIWILNLVLFSVNLCRLTSRRSLHFHPSGPSKPNSFRHFAFLGRFLTELENACSSQVPKSHRCCDDPAEDYGVKDRLNGNEPTFFEPPSVV